MRILAPGGPECSRRALYQETLKAMALSGIEASVSRVEQLDEEAQGGTTTPALVIAGEVMARGRVPKATEIADWLIQAASR